MPPEDQILRGSTKTQEKGQLDVVALVVSCSAGTHNCGHQRSRLRTQSPGNGVSHHNNKKAQFCLYVYSCLQTDTEEGNLNWYVK